MGVMAFVVAGTLTPALSQRERELDKTT